MALKWLRDNLKSLAWVLWLVIGVFVLLVFFEWGGVNRAPDPRTDVAATVGQGRITWAELQNQYQNLERQYRDVLGEQFDREMAQRFNLPAQALNQLIEREILLQEAGRTGLSATDAEVQRAILEVPALLDENGRFVGAERYVRILRQNRIDVAEFESSVRRDVVLDKLRSVLRASIWVEDAELERAYRDRTEKASVRYVQLPASEFLGQVTADADRIAEYFAANREVFELPEQRVIDYLLVSKAQLRREIEVPESEMRAYYDANPEEFSREEEVQARHILFKVDPGENDDEVEEELIAVRAQVENGADFAELARERSEDQGSASRGGDLGYFARGRMIPAFEAAAFGAAPGDLVGPVRTDFGFHLIEVTDRRQGGTSSFEEVEPRIRARLLQDRVDGIAEAKARDLADRLAELEAPQTADLERIASEEGLEVRTSEPFGNEATIPGVGRAPALLEEAFSMEKGELSPALQVPTGWIVFRLAEIREPRVPELSEVEDRVREAVESEMRQEAATARLAALRDATSGDLEAIGEELGLEVQEATDIGRTGSIGATGAGPAALDAAFELPVGEAGGPFATRDGALVLVVTERSEFDPAAFAEERESVRSEEEARRLEQLLASIVEVRRRDLAPEYDPRVLEQFDIEPPALG